MIYGIDVSHYQGEIDWKKVAYSGKKFAILKCMYENSHNPDEYFVKNYNGCIQNGIEVGVYIYHARKSFDNVVGEAKDVLKILSGRKLSYGIWHDLEDKNIRAKGKQAINSFVESQDAIFKQAGYTTGIYCNKDWYYNVLDSNYLKKKYLFWVARYPSLDNGTVKESLSPRAYAACWQYSSKGSVPGIKGNVDMDIDYEHVAQTVCSPLQDNLKCDIREITTAHLNARLEPSNGLVMSTYEKGDKVHVVEEKNGWCRVEAWVSAQYLKK